MKKIERIAKGETIIVNMIAENLQDEWDRCADLKDEAKRAHEKHVEELKSEAVAKEMTLKSMAAEKAHLDFWAKVHEQYGYWGQPIGLRDGYALVKFDPKQKMKLFGNFLKSHLFGDIEDHEDRDGGFQGFTKGE